MFRKGLIALVLIIAEGFSIKAMAADDTVSIPVLRQDVARGEVIDEDDLRYTDVPSRRTRGNIAVDASEVIGYAARRRLRAGQMLRLTDVEVPVLVEKNAIVTMVLKMDDMTLTVQGRAQDRGAEGDFIRVLNTDSMQTVEGRVVAPNIVEISAPARLTALASY